MSSRSSGKLGHSLVRLSPPLAIAVSTHSENYYPEAGYPELIRLQARMTRIFPASFMTYRRHHHHVSDDPVNPELLERNRYWNERKLSRMNEKGLYNRSSPYHSVYHIIIFILNTYLSMHHNLVDIELAILSKWCSM